MADLEVTEGIGQAGAYEEPFFETIKRLAKLPTVEYERCRKSEAKRLKMRASVLDREVKAARGDAEQGDDLGLFEPEPWPEEVDGDDLLDRLFSALKSHVVMSDDSAGTVALWIGHDLRSVLKRGPGLRSCRTTTCRDR